METEASWLADGVKEIERVTRAAAIVEAKVIKLEQEKPGTYAIVTPTPAGQPPQMEIRTAGPLWHNERLDTPEQLQAFIDSMEARGVKAEAGAIYIGREAIRYVQSYDDRRDRATCPLVVSQPWKWLMSPTNPMDQRTIIRVLRILFAGCLSPQSNLIDVLRKVKWSQGGVMESDIQRGKEALGRQILNEAAGMTAFPDEFTLTVPVFENVKHTVAVSVALEVLPDVQKFEIIPFPNQLHNGMENTLLRLQSQLAETDVPTFIGAVSAGNE